METLEAIKPSAKKVIRHKTGQIVKRGSVTLDDGQEVSIYQPKVSSYQVDTSFVQMYFAAIQLQFQLNGCAKDLLNYMLMKMDKDNQITLVVRQKEEFLEMAVDESGNQLYVKRTVDNALTTLKQKRMIRKTTQGSYVVNAAYYFKDDVKRDNGKKRFDMIRLELEFQEGENMAKFRHKKFLNGKEVKDESAAQTTI